MPSEILSVIIGGTVALITSGLTGWFAYRATVKRVESERESSVATGARTIVEATEKQIENLLRTVTRLDDEVIVLRNEIKYQKSRTTRLANLVKDLYDGSLELVRQLEQMELVPVWTPPKDLEIGE